LTDSKPKADIEKNNIKEESTPFSESTPFPTTIKEEEPVQVES
jgi:hypothetical protein